jgi:hypothetical protein
MPSAWCALERAISAIRIDALAESTRPAIERAALRRFSTPSADDLSVSAGAHVVHYRAIGEIRNGPGVYEARVDGPRGAQITRFLGGRQLVRNWLKPAPYHAARNWFLFHAVDAAAEGGTLYVVDLATGDVLVSLPVRGGAWPAGWLGHGTEMVYGVYEVARTSSWHAFDVVARRHRFIGRGPADAYLTTDGRHLLLVDTRDVLLLLFDAARGGEVDRRSAADLHDLTERAQTLEPVEFDAGRGVLTAMLNWRRIDWRTRAVDYERGVSITIVPGT